MNKLRHVKCTMYILKYIILYYMQMCTNFSLVDFILYSQSIITLNQQPYQHILIICYLNPHYTPLTIVSSKIYKKHWHKLHSKTTEKNVYCLSESII